MGGHLEPGETPEEALRRECLEELGIHVEEFSPIPLAVHDPALSMNAFVVTKWRGEPSNTAPDEHDDLAWFTATEIAELVLAHPAARAQLQVVATRQP